MNAKGTPLEAAFLMQKDFDLLAMDTDAQDGVAYLTEVVASDIDRVQNRPATGKGRSQQTNDSACTRGLQHYRQAVLDSTLPIRINLRLSLNPSTSGLDITVDSAEGVVTLSGAVTSAEQGRLVVDIARSTNGARCVIDNLCF